MSQRHELLLLHEEDQAKSTWSSKLSTVTHTCSRSNGCRFYRLHAWHALRASNTSLELQGKAQVQIVNPNTYAKVTFKIVLDQLCVATVI